MSPTDDADWPPSLEWLAAHRIRMKTDWPKEHAKSSKLGWIRVECDFLAGGVWDREQSTVQPEFLPISDDLVFRILRWNDMYDRSVGYRNKPTEELLAQHDGEGLAIAKAFKRECPEWTVVFTHELRRRARSADRNETIYGDE